ncbi:hypothetical protein ACFU6S_21435 [Streptomyces sp. NPDC057456]|uniref:hypothetical protein n=1 Tax=Streptomyces sp. NPDC057456 TaxID=3346139 RepID=UPI0036AE31C1
MARPYSGRDEHGGHRPVVAFKKPKSLREKLTARMLREIEVAQALGGNRHVMPVLDSSPRAEWFVMPLAQATAEQRQSELQHDGPSVMRVLLRAGLSAGIPAQSGAVLSHCDRGRALVVGGVLRPLGPPR